MPKTSKKRTGVTEAKASLERMLEIIKPYAPKSTGIVVPVTAEWQIADTESETTPRINLRHATEPA